jgi:hypothetical protein
MIYLELTKMIMLMSIIAVIALPTMILIMARFGWFAPIKLKVFGRTYYLMPEDKRKEFDEC